MKSVVRPRRRRRTAHLIVSLATLALISAAPASAKQFTLSAAETANRDCTTSAPGGGPAVATETVRAPYAAAITASLAGGTGDWDLAVVDPRSGRVVAGSASRRSRAPRTPTAFAAPRAMT